MPTFNDLKNMVKYLERSLESTLIEEVNEDIKKTIKKHIDSDVYDQYDPSVYQRTGQLKDSVDGYVTPKTEGLELTVEHDTDKMFHYSLVGDKPNEYVQHNLPYWIEEGKVHPLFGEGYSYLEPRPYMKNSIDEIKSNQIHIKSLKRGLTKRGIQAE